MEVEGQQKEMPTTDEKTKIKRHFKKLRCPFVVYADFQCLTEELKKAEGDEMKTYNYQEHKPCGFMLNLVNAVEILIMSSCQEELTPLMFFCNKGNEIRDAINEKTARE